MLMKNKLIIVIIMSMVAINLEAFQNLTNAKAYADAHAEYPKLVGNNIIDPDYSAVYKEMRPTLAQRTLRRFGKQIKSLWSAETFKKLLIKSVHERENNGYWGRFVLKAMARAYQSKAVIFGALAGDFHSLIRDLEELKRLSIINDNLEVINSNYYIIFNGNIANGSPYILETLTLIMELLDKNPAQVIFIRGKYEDRLYWKNYDLKKELQAKLISISREPIPLSRYLARFFDTLPLALYIDIYGPEKNMIRVSYFGRENTEIEEMSCIATTSLDSERKISFCQPSGKVKTAPLIKAIIKGETRLTSYANHLGLALLEPDKGITAWSTFSAPTKIYQEYFDFYYDAFVIVDLKDPISNSTITSYYQDSRDQRGFHKSLSYNIVSGQKIEDITNAKIAQGEPIIVGSTMDFTKSSKDQGKQGRAGITLRINQQNQNGGINGRPIQVVYMDDEYTPSYARRNILEFIEKYKSSLILAPLGSPTLESYFDLVKEKKVFVFFPLTGAPFFRRPDVTNIVHWTASYDAEGKAVTEYTIKEKAPNLVAFFYQDDAFGKGALIGGHAAAKAANIPVLDVPYARNTTDFKEAIDKIMRAQAGSIGFFSTSIAATEFIRQAKVERLTDKVLFGISYLSEEAFKKFLHQKGLDMNISNFSPNIHNSKLPFMLEAKELAEAEGDLIFDTFLVEGYLCADLFIYILNQISGEITHEKIHEVIKSIKNVNYKGITLNYNPDKQELFNKLWIDNGQPDWIEKTID